MAIKRLLLIVAACLSALQLAAQSDSESHLMEVEIGVGMNCPATTGGRPMKIGVQGFLEVRTNIPKSILSLGTQFMVGKFSRVMYNQGNALDIRHRYSVSLTGDYNFYHWDKVTPFVGIGMGYASVERRYTWVDNTPPPGYSGSIERGHALVTAPRIGVEILDHLRITLEYRIMKDEYSFFGLNIGGVLGGGKKMRALNDDSE